MGSTLLLRVLRATTVLIGCNLTASCLSSQKLTSAAQSASGPPSTVRVQLKQHGLPASFFSPGTDTKCADRIIGYRFVVWLDSKTLAVGFNTSPNCRLSPHRK